MGQYQFIINSDAPNILPENEFLKIKSADLEIVSNTETNDTSFNSLTLKPSFTKLHSLMQNNFYEPLDRQLTVERQQHLEKICSMKYLYDADKYLGEQDEFLVRINYLFRLLNINPPISFLTYLRSYFYLPDYSNNAMEGDNTNLINRWYRDILSSNYLIKKLVGTTAIYEYILKSFYRYGSITIRSKYINVGVFTPFTNKYFKLLDFFGKGNILNESSMFYLLPETTNTKWPNSVNFFGIKEVNDLKSLDYYKYDTGVLHDSEIAEDVYLNYDTGIPLAVSGSGLVMDITADSVLYHTNSLFYNECIMDNPWLDYISEFARKAKRASDQLMVGTQISLVASNTGQYISDPSVQRIDDDLYTHPNIKAKFQVIKENYLINRNIAYVRLGTSTYDDGDDLTVFADHTMNPDDCDIPVDVKQPAFEMEVGQYEVNNLSNYINLNVMVHKNTFTKQELLDAKLKIAQANNPDTEIDPIPLTTIVFPHKTLSVGSCTFKIEMLFDTDNGSFTKRYLLIKEVYNTSFKKYIPIVFYLDENEYKLSSESIDVLVDYNEDYEYSMETDYYPTLTDNLIKVLPIEQIGELTTFCRINHIEGTLELKLQIDNTSKLNFIGQYNGTGMLDDMDVTVECSYDTNSIRSLSASTNSLSSLIGISEIGIFNTGKQMIAYGSFPYIIYDTNKYHVTFNCAMKLPEIIE